MKLLSDPFISRLLITLAIYTAMMLLWTHAAVSTDTPRPTHAAAVQY